ncbi:MAG TPA: CBS domain-containing protein [Steroidobacteraceae bacterium]|nr:CBS domain-containing protein [Steroidobacteraceae bacterium]
MAEKIRDVMTREVTTVSPDARLTDVARIMRDEDIGSVPVAQGNELLGMITDRDIVIRALADGDGIESRTAGDVMTAGVQCCREDQNVGDVLKDMGDQQIRRLPVVDDARRLVGIVSIGDLSREAKPKQVGSALEDISQPTGH